jgi:hypothetical protein
MTVNSIPDIFSSITSTERFNMSQLIRAIHASGHPVFRDVYYSLTAQIPMKTADYVFTGLIRNAFLAELVIKTKKGGATKMKPRWEVSQELRNASYEECELIFTSLNNALKMSLQDKSVIELLSLLIKHHAVAYELPIDYKERRIDVPIHRNDNIYFFFSELPYRVAKLRVGLSGTLSSGLQKIIDEAYDKVRTKAYLTDRAQTGEFQTNREKRWEHDPAGPQFAYRRYCMEVEYELVREIFYLDGVPTELINLRERFEKTELLIRPNTVPIRCPITLEPLHFDEFKKEMLNKKHGKSYFHVGHIDPLASIEKSGHKGENISWISEDGNRIQGKLTMSEVRDLLRRIAKNYQENGIS